MATVALSFTKLALQPAMAVGVLPRSDRPLCCALCKSACAEYYAGLVLPECTQADLSFASAPCTDPH